MRALFDTSVCGSGRTHFLNDGGLLHGTFKQTTRAAARVMRRIR
jgi:hypothetical protein